MYTRTERRVEMLEASWYSMRNRIYFVLFGGRQSLISRKHFLVEKQNWYAYGICVYVYRYTRIHVYYVYTCIYICILVWQLHGYEGTNEEVWLREPTRVYSSLVQSLLPG